MASFGEWPDDPDETPWQRYRRLQAAGHPVEPPDEDNRPGPSQGRLNTSQFGDAGR